MKLNKITSNDEGYMKSAGYNDHDGGFEKCPYCGETYNGYERIALGLENGELFHCRRCNNLIAFRY